MPGNTATIDVAVLREQWSSQMPMVAICTHHTISKDQLIRLKFVFDLPPRHDRSLRYKPPRPPKVDQAEDEASRSSLALAPQVAARVTAVQAQWTEEVRMSRQTAQSSPFLVRWVRAADVIQKFLDDEYEPPVEVE